MNNLLNDILSTDSGQPQGSTRDAETSIPPPVTETPRVEPSVKSEAAVPPAAPKLKIPEDVLKPQTATPPPVEPVVSDPPKATVQKEYAWAQTKKAAKEAEQKAAQEAELRAQVEKENQELKSRLETMEAKVGQLDLTQSRAFRERFDDRMNELYSRGVQVFMQSGKDQQTAVNTMNALMTKAGDLGAVQEVLGMEPVFVQGTIGNLLMEHTAIANQRNAALQEWKQSRAMISAEEQRMRDASVNMNAEANVSEALSTLRQEGSWLYTESDKDDQWNQLLAERKNAAYAILKNGNQAELTKYVLEGLAARTYRKLFEEARQEHAALVEEFNRHVNVRPKIGGRADESAPVVDRSKGPVGHQEFLDKMFA